MSLIDASGLRDELRQFSSDRDWDQFHTPKNIAMALSAEVGELTELFQWLTPEESWLSDRKTRSLDMLPRRSPTSPSTWCDSPTSSASTSTGPSQRS